MQVKEKQTDQFKIAPNLLGMYNNCYCYNQVVSDLGISLHVYLSKLCVRKTQQFKFCYQLVTASNEFIIKSVKNCDWQTVLVLYTFFVSLLKKNLNTAQENKKPKGCPSPYNLSRWQINQMMMNIRFEGLTRWNIHNRGWWRVPEPGIRS